MSKIFDNEKALIEIIKYGSKIFTEPDVNKKAYTKKGSKIYSGALHHIFKHMKHHRLFDRFGFEENKRENIGATLLGNHSSWSYDMGVSDWVDLESGELLSKYIPSHELDLLLTKGIDIKNS